MAGDQVKLVLSCNPSVTIPTGCNVNTYANYDALNKGSDRLVVNLPNDHGTQVTSTLISALSNQSGIVGVAPHAQVIPVKAGNGLLIKTSELIHAFTTLGTNPAYSDVDVVSMSIGSVIQSDDVFRNIVTGRYGDGSFDRARKAVQRLLDRGVVVVVSAGNSGIDAKNSLWTMTGALPVGAVQVPPAGLHSSRPFLPNPPNPGKLTRSVWSATSGSNWSPGQADNTNSANLENLVAVYAPGSEMIAMGVPQVTLTGPTPSPGASPPVVSVPVLTSNVVGTARPMPWSGTSAAAPVVSGIVALMKGIKESASITEIRNAFYNTSTVSSYTDTNLLRFDGTPFSAPLQLRIVNAEAAVQRIYQTNNSGDGRMQTYTGTLTQSGDTYQLRLAGSSSTVYNLQWGKTSSVTTLNTQIGLRVPENTTTRSFVNLNAAVSQPVQIQGQLRGSRLYVHQLTVLKAPTTPTGLTSSNVQTNSFKVSWNPVATATSYRVGINGPSGIVYQTVTTPEIVVQYYPASPTALVPGTTYVVSVQAQNSGGLSAASSTLAVQTLTPSPTPTPACNTKVTDTVITDTAWKWSGGNTVIVNNPYFTPQIPGAFPIWVSSGACTQCSYVLFKDYTLPSGYYVNKASVVIQASEYADISVRGRAVGQASYKNSVTPKTFTIDPAFFGASGNTLSLTFLAQNFSLPRPAVLAKFTIERCRP